MRENECNECMFRQSNKVLDKLTGWLRDNYLTNHLFRMQGILNDMQRDLKNGKHEDVSLMIENMKLTINQFQVDLGIIKKNITFDQNKKK